MKKIKVVHIVYKWDKLAMNNIINRYIEVFLNDLYENTVIVIDGNSDTPINFKNKNCSFIGLNKKSSLRGLKIKTIYEIYKICKSEKYDIAICHRYAPFFITLLVNILYPFQKVLAIFHGLDQFKKIGRRILFFLFNKQNITAIGVSEAVRNDLCNNLWGFPKEKIVTVWNIINTDSIENTFIDREQARIQLGIKKDWFVFGTIGTLNLNKGHEFLLTAFSLIKNDFPKVKIVIIGGGLKDDLFKQANMLGIQNRVSFQGYVPDASHMLKAFDVFIFPSIKEGFGLVLLEAMAAKLPILTTDAGGIEEVVGNHGIIVPKGNAKALSEKMYELANSSQHYRSHLGEKLYITLHSQFRRDDFIKKVSSLLP